MNKVEDSTQKELYLQMPGGHLRQLKKTNVN